jgi:uncharacterized RDD family membrane protein YckC
LKVAAEELNIRGLTGVDMTLQVAGPGTRSYAFIIDWHIRLLVALAWILLGWLAAGGMGVELKSALFGLGFVLPATLIYLFYHPILELAMHGRTPGKRMAGCRIVTLEGATPGTGALLIRNLFRLIDSLPIFYLVGLVCCMVTAQRVRIGDLAAGTVLVLDEQKASRTLGAFGKLAQSTRLNPDTAALIQDLLERWAELEPGNAETLARELLARLDSGLDTVQLAALDAPTLRSRLEALLG